MWPLKVVHHGYRYLIFNNRQNVACTPVVECIPVAIFSCQPWPPALGLLLTLLTLVFSCGLRQADLVTVFLICSQYPKLAAKEPTLQAQVVKIEWFLSLAVVFKCSSAAPVEYNSTTELSDYVADEVTDDDVSGVSLQCLSPELAAEITKIVNNASPFIKHQGNLPAFAATSSKQMLLLKSESKSGYYWIQEPTKAVCVFCLVNSENLFSEEGVWMKIAAVSMTKPAATCPDLLKRASVSSRELCRRTSARTPLFSWSMCNKIKLIKVIHTRKYKLLKVSASVPMRIFKNLLQPNPC